MARWWRWWVSQAWEIPPALRIHLLPSHQGWLLLESSSVSYGKATAYLPLIDLLKGYFQVETDDPERRIREKMAGKLLLLDETLMPLLPVFLTLLDVPVDDSQRHALDPPQRRRSRRWRR
jgi:hypothetical protein